jgi:hypothetical protein
MPDTINAWLVVLSQDISINRFQVTLPKKYHHLEKIIEGDILVFVDKSKLASFARVFRIRENIDETVFYFDGFLDAIISLELSHFGITQDLATPISRLAFTVCEKMLEEVCKISYKKFPLFSGEVPDEQAHIRNLLQMAVIDDLLGPADGPYEEIIEMSVRDRYLVGKLAPIEHDESHTAKISSSKDDQQDIGENPEVYANTNHIPFDKTATVDFEDDEEKEIDASDSRSLVPSAMGFTFYVDHKVNTILLSSSWGHYERTDSEKIDERRGRPYRCWKRIPQGGLTELPLTEGKISSFSPDGDCPWVKIEGSVSGILENDARLVTLFMVNTAEKPPQNQDQVWVFQPQMTVSSKNGQPVFHRRPIPLTDASDNELQSLEMIYRKRVEFAVGHGVSVHAKVSDSDPELAVELRTAVIPEYEVQNTAASDFRVEERPGLAKMSAEGFFDMKNLARLDKDDLSKGLTMLVDDYAKWIDNEKSRKGTELRSYNKQTEGVIQQCNLILDRLKEGISVLASDKNALLAFRLANEAMALQRIHSIYVRRIQKGDEVTLESLDKPENRSWYPFQLAFILLAIPPLANPIHDDRTKPLDAIADLLWFPTGGGKTEAYLGIAAFAMAIRRLQGTLGGLDGLRGLTVIMRYTLRLLTIQQFQRAATLLCAMENIRKSNIDLWGIEPFTLGLWVGQKVTPNTTEESSTAIENERDKHYGTGSTPAQLTSCPWCGAEISATRDIIVDKEIGRTFIYCSDKYGRCVFSKTKAEGSGLPVLVVDEEIYHHPPSMLIATVDKFAMMAWRGETRTLFGKSTLECPRHGMLWPDSKCNGNHQKIGRNPATHSKRILPLRPPDLIIQDEFHLISGPLGTMVGLYETAIDELVSWPLDGKTVRPKIIASTATVRKADEQVNNVFMRKVSIFPPHGFDVEDNFFSIQRSANEKPGRLYIGICSPGASRPAVLIRVYVAFLTGAQAIFEHFGSVADPYMTLIGYFNTLRELGGMRRLAEDDIQTRSYRVEMSRVNRPGLKQRSVRNIDELTSRVSNKDIPKKLKQLEAIYKKKYVEDDLRPLDIVLATNMLSVGVDIDRLGLMVVNGQPKNTAEYIQATSRIGRRFPGLVATVLTWARPRDLSHYETFEHYHATFYKHVEAQSVTPFSSRSLDRGLTGVMISLLRLGSEKFNPNLGAGRMGNSSYDDIEQITNSISARAWKITNKKDVNGHTEMMCKERIDKWVREVQIPGRRLGYERVRGQGDIKNLLIKPGITLWTNFTVPMSMREVEPGVQLILDDSLHPESPQWQYQKPKREPSAERTRASEGSPQDGENE